MERIIYTILGYVRVEVSGAQPVNVLNLCADTGVKFWWVEYVDEFTLRLTVRSRHLPKLQDLVRRGQCSVKWVKPCGFPVHLKKLRGRYVLLAGLLACLAALAWSSLHIWEIEVKGNETVPAWRILGALDECGVGIGSFWPSISTEDVRSRVQLILPEISWLTVNVQGSRAEVLVRERTLKPEIVDEKTPHDIVAGKTGIISEMRVYRGAAAVSVGQTVLAGEKLVSCYVPSSFAPPRMVHALADVKARTWYEISAAAPLKYREKAYTGRESTKYALILGTKRINFYLNSGISEPNCDKIITVDQLKWENVFALPVKLVTEKYLEFETRSVPEDRSGLRKRLEAQLMSRLLEQIGEDGKVVSSQYSFSEKNGLLTVTLRAECTEQIAVKQPIVVQ
ncbi:MAG: sporulation protein YqfD [Oscillospiraceae bacterium]|jgi:similar to stage IV sporulation protein